MIYCSLYKVIAISLVVFMLRNLKKITRLFIHKKLHALIIIVYTFCIDNGFYNTVEYNPW